MIFSEAIAALQEGKYVARPSWAKEGKFCVLMPGMMSVWQILTQPTPNAGNVLFSVEDYTTDDWMVVDKDTYIAKTEESAAQN